MKVQDYLQNPTSASALCFWKTNAIKPPSHLKIVRDDAFSADLLMDYSDEPFFKLLHDLRHINKVNLPDGFVFSRCTLKAIADHINACYDPEGVTEEELNQYTKRPVYDSDLWICIYDTLNGQMVASGIAEFDQEILEGNLDWIQVSKDYRRQGFGKIIVNELLRRLSQKAKFVTVSGRMNNETKPDMLYKNCGFRNQVIWHVLSKKNRTETP